MSTQSFEDLHPRATAGRFAAKPSWEPAAGLDTLLVTADQAREYQPPAATEYALDWGTIVCTDCGTGMARAAADGDPQDFPAHCAECQKLIAMPLTEIGVAEMFNQMVSGQAADADARAWRAQYGPQLEAHIYEHVPVGDCGCDNAVCLTDMSQGKQDRFRAVHARAYEAAHDAIGSLDIADRDEAEEFAGHVANGYAIHTGCDPESEPDYRAELAMFANGRRAAVCLESDHPEGRCCSEHLVHVAPHRGCILR